MKEWNNPEMWKLDAEYTQGSLEGSNEDHILVSEHPHVYGSQS